MSASTSLDAPDASAEPVALCRLPFAFAKRHRCCCNSKSIAPKATQQNEVVTEASRDEQRHVRGADATEATLLYSPGQIAFMTLFGTPLAGFYGIFRNYSRLGALSKARGTVVTSCFIIPLMILSFLTLPGSAYDKMFPVFSVVLLGGVCKLTQGRMLEDAQMKGARYHKIWNQCLVIFFFIAHVVGGISSCPFSAVSLKRLQDEVCLCFPG